jgi:hypothetical protein
MKRRERSPDLKRKRRLVPVDRRRLAHDVPIEAPADGLREHGELVQ